MLDFWQWSRCVQDPKIPPIWLLRHLWHHLFKSFADFLTSTFFWDTLYNYTTLNANTKILLLTVECYIPNTCIIWHITKCYSISPVYSSNQFYQESTVLHTVKLCKIRTSYFHSFLLLYLISFLICTNSV